MDYLISDVCEYIRNTFWGITDFKAFSVLIILLILLIFILPGRKTADRCLIALLIVSLYFIFSGTILIRPKTENIHSMLTPFWSYKLALGNSYYRYEIVENILLFVPSGILMGMIFRDKRSLFPIAFLLGFSVCIECMQYFLSVGLCEFDDVFNNTLGAVIGYYGVLLLYKKQPGGNH